MTFAQKYAKNEKIHNFQPIITKFDLENTDNIFWRFDYFIGSNNGEIFGNMTF